jgi:hypothetical protein
MEKPVESTQQPSLLITDTLDIDLIPRSVKKYSGVSGDVFPLAGMLETLSFTV